MGHIIGLNGIRAIAVFMVILSHRFPQGHVVHTFPLGNIGVDIFFVLSGYLISRILFVQVIKIRTDEKNKWLIIKNFLARRVIRIFPIYYLTLIFLYLTKSIIGNNFSENIWWYVTYTSNYLNYFDTKWYGAFAHLWSLSVEEQFYLVWPFLLFFIFIKRIPLILFLFIIGGTFYPFLMDGWTGIIMFSCLNAFGVGALLAYVEIFKPENVDKVISWLKWIALVAFILLIVNYIFIKISHFPSRIFTSITAVWLIALCRYYPKNFWVSKVLNFPILSWLGTISYGIYIFHNFIPRYWRYAMVKLEINSPSVYYQFSYIEFSIEIIALVLISYASWLLIEMPILKLKKYVKY